MADKMVVMTARWWADLLVADWGQSATTATQGVDLSTFDQQNPVSSPLYHYSNTQIGQQAR